MRSLGHGAKTDRIEGLVALRAAFRKWSTALMPRTPQATTPRLRMARTTRALGGHPDLIEMGRTSEAPSHDRIGCLRLLALDHTLIERHSLCVVAVALRA